MSSISLLTFLKLKTQNAYLKKIFLKIDLLKLYNKKIQMSSQNTLHYSKICCLPHARLESIKREKKETI